MLDAYSKRLINSKQAFSFDLDGTIANLEQLNFTGMQKSILKFGGPNVTFHEFREFVAGRPAVMGVKELLEHKGFSALAQKTPEILKDFRKLKKYLLEHEFDQHVKIVPGAKTYLKWLKLSGRKIALVTSTVKNLTIIILKQAKIYNLFDVVITADDIKKGKPDPEPYLLGLERLEVLTSEAVAFEDSKIGITSAKSAGLLTVGILTKGLNDNVVKLADIVIQNYNELL